MRTHVITEIHILGSSLINNLAGYVEKGRGDRGIPNPPNIKGESGLGLMGMRQLMDKNLKEKGMGYVIVHAGANDICNGKEREWLLELEATLAYMKARFKGYQPVWSDMLPRINWRHKPNDMHHRAEDIRNEEYVRNVMDKCRKRLQRRARLKFAEFGGKIIHHPSLQQDLGLLSPKDGVHLTQQGQADFWGDFLNFIHNVSAGKGY